MNLKDFVLGGVFGIFVTGAIGGGMYGFYLKTTSRVALTEVDAYRMLGKCVVINSEPIPDRTEKIKFLTAVDEKFPSVVIGDAVTSSVAQVMGGGPAQTGFAPLLRACAAELRKKVEHPSS